MKRWNQKGTVYAKRRMAELREVKRQHLKGDLIAAWGRATGRPTREWWDAAMATGLRPGCGVEASIAFLRSAIAQSEATR